MGVPGSPLWLKKLLRSWLIPSSRWLWVENVGRKLGVGKSFPFFKCIVLQSNLMMWVSTESGLLMWDFIFGVPRKGGDWWQDKTNGSPLEVPLRPPWRDMWASPRTHSSIICHDMDGFQATQFRPRERPRANGRETDSLLDKDKC